MRTLFLLLLLTLTACGTSDDKSFTLAATTSTENSGLLAVLLPRFTDGTGISVKLVALGTGQAIRLAQRGDADLLWVHHRPSEDRFVTDGYAEARYDVMYNDFVVLGPKADPAKLREAASLADAVQRATRTAVWVSRGDDSGTHKRELALLRRAGIDPSTLDTRRYLEVGAGMGAALNIAVAKDAYVLSDRATWLAFKNKREHAVLVEGHKQLHNPYGLLPVSSKRHPHVKAAAAQAFVTWIRSQPGQDAINAFRVEGQQVFFGNTGG